MQNLWWVFAMCAGLMTALFVFSNQIFRLKGSLVMIYRGIGTAICLLPFSFIVTPPSGSLFYYLCISNGLLIAFLDNRILNAAKTFGAEHAAMLQPLSIVFEFFVWFLFVPQLFIQMFDSPVRMLFTVISVFCLSISVFLLKRNKISTKAFLYLLPAMLSVIIIDIQCKIMMNIDISALISTIFYYSLITSAVAGSINAFVYFKNGNKLKEIIMPQNLFFAGIPLVILMVSIYIFKNCSLHLVENPAYTMAILNLYPIWVSGANVIYNKYFHHHPYPKANKKIMFFIMLAAITLILSVN